MPLLRRQSQHRDEASPDDELVEWAQCGQPEAVGVLQLGVTRTDLVIAGTPVVVTVSVLRDGSMRNVTSEPVQVYVAVLEPAG